MRSGVLPQSAPRVLSRFRTYASVFEASDRRDNHRLVALKIMILDPEEGAPSTAIREIGLLRELNHPNIITLFNVHFPQNKLILVTELCETDLAKYIRNHKMGKIYNHPALSDIKFIIY